MSEAVKKKVVDEKVAEAAKTIKEYCESRKECAEDCIFYKDNSLFNSCNLIQSIPEDWEMEEGRKNGTE